MVVQPEVLIATLGTESQVVTLSLLAELHGRMGYFPSCLRLLPVAGARPPRYEVAEVLDLQSVRDAARTKRR